MQLTRFWLFLGVKNRLFIALAQGSAFDYVHCFGNSEQFLGCAKFGKCTCTTVYNTNLMFFSVQLHKSGFLSSVVWYCPLKRCNAQIFHFAALISNYVFLWYKELYCTLASSVLVKHEDTFCVCKIYPELSTQIIRKGL